MSDQSVEHRVHKRGERDPNRMAGFPCKECNLWRFPDWWDGYEAATVEARLKLEQDIELFVHDCAAVELEQENARLRELVEHLLSHLTVDHNLVCDEVEDLAAFVKEERDASL